MPRKENVVDVLVIGSGTGLAAALSARELGADVLVLEKTGYVGGSTARSGGAFWIPSTHLLTEQGGDDPARRAHEYLQAAVGNDAPAGRWQNFLKHGDPTVRMLERTTDLTFTWAKGYADYHPELPGGSAVGRSCESAPFDTRRLKEHRQKLRPATLAAPIPMPVTGADYKWLNLMARVPLRGLVTAAHRALQGVGGKVLGRDYVAGGQALAAGLYDGIIRAGIPLWTEMELQELVVKKGRVIGARVHHGGTVFTVLARRGVILAAGGFDHALGRRHQVQSPHLGPWSLGSEGNTGDGIAAAERLGAATDLLDQAWWFPAIAPTPGKPPGVMLAERSLPGSFMVDQTGQRFINESTDYMSFGQEILRRENEGNPVGDVWLIFDQKYRNDYLFAGGLMPRMQLPQEWYDHGIAVRASSWAELAAKTGLPSGALEETGGRFNYLARAGSDDDFGRGRSAYDRYYGDPTIRPNPNLRALDSRRLYAVRTVLSDLGTCGGLKTNEVGEVLHKSGDVIAGLYAIGNTAANIFGKKYPGAGATIGQGLVFGHIAAQHAMGTVPGAKPHQGAGQ